MNYIVIMKEKLFDFDFRLSFFSYSITWDTAHKELWCWNNRRYDDIWWSKKGYITVYSNGAFRKGAVDTASFCIIVIYIFYESSAVKNSELDW